MAVSNRRLFFMASILAVKRRVEAFQPDIAIMQAMQKCEQDLIAVNQEQMYDGKTKHGTDIRPSYLEDPYFKTPAQAIAYAEWKNRITPNPRRGKFTPNLFINGYWYGNQQVMVLVDRILYLNTYASFGNDIDSKYKDIHGLGGRFKEVFLRVYYMPVFREQIKEEIKL